MKIPAEHPTDPAQRAYLAEIDRRIEAAKRSRFHLLLALADAYADSKPGSVDRDLARAALAEALARDRRDLALAADALEQAAEVLRECEDWGECISCPICDAYMPSNEGHAPDCKLAALIERRRVDGRSRMGAHLA